MEMHFSRLLRNLALVSKDFTYSGVHFHGELINVKKFPEFHEISQNHTKVSMFIQNRLLRPQRANRYKRNGLSGVLELHFRKSAKFMYFSDFHEIPRFCEILHFA